MSKNKINPNDNKTFLSDKRWLKLLLSLPIIYLILFIFARLFAAVVELPISSERIIGDADALWFTLWFFLFFTPLLYAFASLLAGGAICLKNSLLVLYVGATFFGGVCGEILFGHIGDNVINHPLWEYRVWPKHDSHTTGVGIVMWPMYGFYLYCFHQALQKKGFLVYQLAFFSGMLIAIDAMVLEVLANVFAIVFFDSYYFFYFAADILHFTSAEIFLPYFLFGVLGTVLLLICRRLPIANFILGIGFYIVAFLIVFS